MTDHVLQVDQVTPGPCDPILGCPPATEIDCIRVEKVFDFCFEQDVGLQNCVPIPETCDGIAAGSTAACTIDAVNCTTGTPTPIPGQDGFATVPKTVHIAYHVTIFNPNGTVHCTFPATFTFSRTIVLCAPEGTSQDCQTFATCGNCTILPPSTGFPRGQVCCLFNLCTLAESHAFVKLLVPTFGFCTPAPCRTGGFPPFPCPPSPLFPPQCTPLT